MNGFGKVFILGDSYSTFKGYIPEGYHCYYSGEGENAVIKSVAETWWHRVITKTNSELVLNDSFSGSTVCNSVRPTLTIDTSFVSRIDKYIKEDFFAKNGVDTIFIFGGTNDSWVDCPRGEVIYSGWNEESLLCALPAFSYIIDRIKNCYPNIRIITILNCNINEQLTRNYAVISQKYAVECVTLTDIDKVDGHPTSLGMEQICNQILKATNT